MSRLISAVRRLSAASTPAFLLHAQSTRHPLFRQPPTPPPLPQHTSTRHFLSRQLYSSAAVRISSASANTPAVPISLTSFFCTCQFVLFSNLSKSFASGAKHVEDIIVILRQIKHLLQTRFSQQCMQVLFLMCGAVLSLIFPVVQAIKIAVEEALADNTTILGLIFAGGVVAAGLLVKFFWDKLFRRRTMHTWLPATFHY